MTTPYRRAVDIGENHRTILLPPSLTEWLNVYRHGGHELAETAARNEPGIKATAHGVPPHWARYAAGLEVRTRSCRKRQPQNTIGLTRTVGLSVKQAEGYRYG
jgi:hypothetical protein